MNSKLHQRLERIWESPNLLQFFQKYSKRKPNVFKKGTVIFNAGDPLAGVYFIEEGFVKLYRVSEEGRETIIYLTGPGNLLSLRAMLSKNKSAHHYTEALTDVTIHSMTWNEFFAVLEAHPEHLIDLMYAFVDRLNHTERRLEGFITADTNARVASFLYDLAKRFDHTDRKNMEIPLPFTHQRIAEFVGSFRETVTLALNRLQKERIIKVSKGKITILDLEKLYKRATNST